MPVLQTTYMKFRFLLSILACLSVTGCYFNSAGDLIQRAGYEAGVNSEDAVAGKYVLTDGSDYYVELPRYMMEKEARIRYDITEKDTRKPGPHKTGQSSLVQIPADFAMYLTGKAEGPTTPASMTPVKNESQVRRTATTRLPIVKKGDSSLQKFRYSSPNAPWLYTAAAFDWLCIDLPFTLIGNSLFIAFSPIILLGETELGNEPPSESQPKQLSEAQTIMLKIVDNGDKRGYITQKEAQAMELCLEYYREYLDYLKESANVDAHNAGVYNSLPTMNRTQRLTNQLNAFHLKSEARAAAQNAKKLEEGLKITSAWLENMRSTGRIR